MKKKSPPKVKTQTADTVATVATVATVSSIPRRAPLFRSAYWAWLIGAVGGGILGAGQVYALHGGWLWAGLGVLLAVPLGIIAGCDLLIPGPGPDNGFRVNRGNRVGPFRWGILLLLMTVEGLFISAFLWGDVTLVCERMGPAQSQSPQIDCRRTTTGWFYSRQTGETLYDNVIGVGLSVHDELLLQHGPYEQSQHASGFGVAELQQLQTFLAGQTPTLTLAASDWRVRLGAPICLLLALLAGVWAWGSVRRGLHSLRTQFALGEVYQGWWRPLTPS